MGKIKCIITSIIILIILLIGSGFLITHHYYSQMATTERLEQSDVGILNELVEKEEDSNIVNIVVLGIDRDGDGSNGRSDAIKVISLDMNNKKVKLTSFQRDTLIYIPDPENDFDKLNHAYWYGKAPLISKSKL